MVFDVEKVVLGFAVVVLGMMMGLVAYMLYARTKKQTEAFANASSSSGISLLDLKEFRVLPAEVRKAYKNQLNHVVDVIVKEREKIWSSFPMGKELIRGIEESMSRLDDPGAPEAIVNELLWFMSGFLIKNPSDRKKLEALVKARRTATAPVKK